GRARRPRPFPSRARAVRGRAVVHHREVEDAGQRLAMYQRIVVPLDSTELSERVLPHAEALAERFGAALTLMHATTPPAAIAAAGHAGLGRLVFGSVADEVVRHAPCPVLLVRTHD